MQQPPSGTPVTFCPFCGSPVGVASARFCAACGRDMLTGAPNAGQAPASAAYTASPASPTGGMPVAPAQVIVVTQSAKSRGVAVLLELLLPGGGALYLGRVGQGLAWLFGSLIAGAIAWVIAFNAAQGAVAACQGYTPSYYGDTCTPNYGSVQGAMLVSAIIGLVWLIIRLSIISNQAAAMERAVVTPTAARWQANAPSAAKVGAARMIWTGVGLIALMLILFYFTGPFAVYPFTGRFFFEAASPFIFYYFSSLVVTNGYAAVAAYLYSVRRLAAVSWGRTLLEAIGFTVALTAVVFSLAFNLVLSVIHDVNINRMTGFFWFFLEMAFATLIGVIFAGWSASWKEIRKRLALAPSGSLRYGAIVMIITVALMSGPLLLRLRSIDASTIAIIGLLLTVIIGSVLTMRWLNRLLAQAAAPTWSPSSTTPTTPTQVQPVQQATMPTPPVAAPTPTPPPPAPPAAPSGAIDPDR